MVKKRTFAVVVILVMSGMLLSGCAQTLAKFKDAIQNPGKGPRGGEPRKVKKQLKNGLTVVVEENFGAPVVAVQVWVNVGSGDETDQEAGVSHVLEHMMFKGTKDHALGEMANAIESLGGDLNAFTSYDQTVYHVTIASRFFDRAVDLLADQVTHSVIDETELSKEQQVILEEIRRSKDSPNSRVYKYLFRESYERHPYGRAVIGSEETVSKLTSDEVRGYYKRWYVPGNMTLVVAGDVRAEDVIKAAQKYFGGMSAESAPSTSPRKTAEPAHAAPRVKVFWEDVADSYLYYSYHIPAFDHEDIAPLDVLSVVMGSGETSRLTYRIGTARRLVNRVFSLSYTPLNPGLFVVGADLDQGKTPEALEMLLKQSCLMKHEPVEDWELAKAKLTLETDFIYSRETVDGQARRIGYFVTYTGDMDYEKKYIQQIRAVTKEDLVRVASKYFTSDNLTVVAMMPERARKRKGHKKDGLDESRIQDIISAVDSWDRKYSPGSLAESQPITPPEVPAADSTPAGKGATASRPPIKFELVNGIRVIVRENYSVPLVSVNAVFEGGVRRETDDINGINNLIARTITEGTARYKSSEIHSKIESRGGSIFGFAGRNAVGVSLEVPSPYFSSCLPVFADVVRYPTFPENEVSRMQGIILSSIRAQMDHPAQAVNRLFREELFKVHPYRQDPLGSEATVKRLTRDDLQAYYESFAVPSNLVIAVVGDVDAVKLKAELELLFKDWVGERYAPPEIPLEPPPTAPREAPLCKDVSQANIMIGFQGAKVDSKDRYALQVLSNVLSGMSGRLFTLLRGEQSLAYQIYAFNEEGIDPGIFAVYIGTAPEKEAQARAGILDQLEEIRQKPISKTELVRAQEILIGDYEIKLQRYMAQAQNYALSELYGLGYKAVEEYAGQIQAVTVRDVEQVAQKYIKPDAAVTAMIKPCDLESKNDGEAAGESGAAFAGKGN